MLHIASFHCYLFYLLKCTYIILSSLFQHVMSLTYEHVLFNWAQHSYVDLVQNIINKRLNAKCEYGKMLWHSSCEKITIE